ncbi:PREDICTED: protein NUCLEAR FUSION DEFECTIVE 4-like [Ipomoea nil]|uniref:protein NUCLEAR FUSION DEFECTIVE 4-like n=1 Tax=Ipomoea nil TaxID=35883 RepID=UPI000900BC31|nr:PREDICTED: protein NUCLEAR FUSION DEFECTIVE 4-like [Ipomoea nil]
MVVGERVKAFFNDRWLVFVASMWVQSCSGIGYLFGSISPVIKTAMGYNQRQVAMLGVAKDLGDAIGFLPGVLCEIMPIWVVLFIGVLQNFFGYGLVWLIVAHKIPELPLWLLCVLIFVGTNGETYFNTGALVSSVQNFPKSRGPIVGILKGFAGLSGAILTQLYTMINFPDQSSLVFMVAVGPSIVITAVMFLVRPVGGHRQARPSDQSSFLFTYSICLILAAYLLAVLLLQDLASVSQNLITVLTIGLVVLVLLPITIPTILVFFPGSRSQLEESLLPGSEKQEPSKSGEDSKEVIFSELEEEKPPEVDTLPPPERQKRIAHLQAKLYQAAAEGAVRVKRRKGPRRGEDFTLLQALVKADFWLIFISLVLASGSGLTVIDNLGQMSESLGYANTHVFVSMISIFNFLGRVAGGYFSENIVRNYAYPRPVAMAAVQIVMAFVLFFYSMGWPGAIYVLSVMVGLCYGAHWAIVPAAISELFGLKSFGALYNFLTLASPAGSLVFSGVIASGIYDYQAKQQQQLTRASNLLADDEVLTCTGTICYSLTCGIMSALCIIAFVLSLIVVHRTKRVYAQLYNKAGN